MIVTGIITQRIIRTDYEIGITLINKRNTKVENDVYFVIVPEHLQDEIEKTWQNINCMFEFIILDGQLYFWNELN